MYHSKLRKVPVPDMTAVLSVRDATRSKPVRQGQFVRLKRKPYKDDLAKVVEVRRKGRTTICQEYEGEEDGMCGGGEGVPMSLREASSHFTIDHASLRRRSVRVGGGER